MEKRSAGGPRKDVGRRKTLKLFGRRNSRKGAGKEEKIRRTSAEARRWAEISEKRQQKLLKMSNCSLEDVGGKTLVGRHFDKTMISKTKLEGGQRESSKRRR